MSFSDSQPPQREPASVRLRWFLRRSLKWMWRSFLIVITLGAVAWTLTFAVGCRKLDKALKAVDSDPSLSYVVPENWDQPAPGENAAPYFTAASSMMSYAFSSQAEAIEIVVAGGWKPPPEDKPKDPYTWIQGWEGLTGEQRLGLQAWLKQQSPALDLAAKGAQRPWCRYARQWSMEPWRVPVPELDGLEKLSQALLVLAHSRVAEGKPREAREAVRDALAVADSLRDDPFLQSQHRRIGLMASILENLPEIVPTALTVEDCDEWLKFLPDVDRFDGCLERAARWELKERVDLFCGSPGRYWFWQRLYYRWGAQDFFKTIRKRLADPIFKIDAARCLKESVRVVEIFRKPYLDARLEAASLEKEWHNINESWRPTAPLVWQYDPSRRLELLQMLRARCAMIRTGIAWERTKIKTGAYPRVCETLDPMTGLPFQVAEGPRRITGAGITGRRSQYVFEVRDGGAHGKPVPEPNMWKLLQ